MSISTETVWKHLEPRPRSSYKQLFVKGTRITARSLYGWYMSDEDPLTPEQLAAEFGLPLEAVQEAIAYCRSDPPEIEAEDRNGRVIQAVTYMARGKEVDGKPSLRYITLLREGARAHGLPEIYIRFLESVEHVQ